MIARSPARLTVSVIALAGLGCHRAPMSYLQTAGPAADPITVLAWGLITLCSVVVLIIILLVLRASLRARIPVGSMADAGISRPGGGARWIYIGTAVSTLLLLGVVVWTMITLAAVASPVQRTAFTIEVRAHQWWWEARYLDGDSQRIFLTANELHIPVGQPVRLRLLSDDVIHSFWIPALAGKTDVIPGQTNLAWIQANTPGTFRGQCTEYCGEQHAHMAQLVVADTPADFQAWWNHQLTEATRPDTEALRQGARVFVARCAACHTVRGAQAGGILGPDLTHLMSRSTIAAGTLRNDPDSLARWIANAQDVKPGCRMPKLEFSQPEFAALTAYVQSLR